MRNAAALVSARASALRLSATTDAAHSPDHRAFCELWAIDRFRARMVSPRRGLAHGSHALAGPPRVLLGGNCPLAAPETWRALWNSGGHRILPWTATLSASLRCAKILMLKASINTAETMRYEHFNSSQASRNRHKPPNLAPERPQATSGCGQSKASLFTSKQTYGNLSAG